MDPERRAARSTQEILRTTVDVDRQRLAAGERPTYHARAAPSIDGSMDVTIRELPLIHLFVPDRAGIMDGARVLVARTLGVDPGAFDIQFDGEWRSLPRD